MLSQKEIIDLETGPLAEIEKLAIKYGGKLDLSLMTPKQTENTGSSHSLK